MASSRSVFVTDRMASRSLMSARPMRSSWVAMVLTLPVVRDPGEEEAPHQGTDGFFIAYVNVGIGAGCVGQQDACRPLPYPAGRFGIELGPQPRPDERAGDAQHLVEAGEGQA